MLKTAEKIKTRHICRADVSQLCRIEAASFDVTDAWREDDFIEALRERANNGYVAVFEDRVVGYLIQGRAGEAYRLLSIAVDPNYRRYGVGRQLIEKLITKLKADGTPNRIEVGVRDRSLETQLFFRDLKFRAVNSVRDYFDDGESLIEFVYRVRKEPNDGDSESLRGV